MHFTKGITTTPKIIPRKEHRKGPINMPARKSMYLGPRKRPMTIPIVAPISVHLFNVSFQVTFLVLFLIFINQTGVEYSNLIA
ncbi:MAG: hypothetical protein A2493_03020 [Candidatus Magasanikbacteria bacterium RIFOXYC12_FULL_33_11]|uniref:Transmembrane protein n=1 Tax=Candidatus Magasanikbacteria bacterium RIFOXYC12_FULL_33_11 TaxID=1798701 RepID=A0A1F6NS78_9BACT|nr:MAG: hypothetical protein A2493_03020 [Candidatus Magasanikbacteria bacterium RIFOXYC12_FULL_33_11]